MPKKKPPAPFIPGCNALFNYVFRVSPGVRLSDILPSCQTQALVSQEKLSLIPRPPINPRPTFLLLVLVGEKISYGSNQDKTYSKNQCTFLNI